MTRYTVKFVKTKLKTSKTIILHMRGSEKGFSTLIWKEKEDNFRILLLWQQCISV